MKSSIQKQLQDFPASELWRLFIDGYRQNEGKWAFDRGKGAEIGYYAAMEDSWKLMLQMLTTPFTVEELKNIHAYCVGKGENQINTVGGGIISKTEFRTEKIYFGLISNKDPYKKLSGSVSNNGLKEFFASSKKLNALPALLSYRKNGESQDFKPDATKTDLQNAKEFNRLICDEGGCFELYPINVKKYTKTILKNYHKKIKEAETEDEKLLVIASVIGKMARLHPFEDANCRTLLMVTYKLLLQNGLGLTILENPNRMDLFSKRQFAKEIKIGQLRFREYCITKARKKLKKFVIRTNQKQETYNQLVEMLGKNLAKHPLVAMAQLNELYRKIMLKEIVLKVDSTAIVIKDFIPFTKKKIASHEKIMISALQRVYHDNLDKFKEIINNSKNEVIEFQNNYSELKKQSDQLYEITTEMTEPEHKNLEIHSKTARAEEKFDKAIKAKQWNLDVLVEWEKIHADLLSEKYGADFDNNLKDTFDEVKALSDEVRVVFGPKNK